MTDSVVNLINDGFTNAGAVAAAKPGQNRQILTSLPKGKENALIVKFIKNPKCGTGAYLPITFYKHLVGPNVERDVRYHPCRKSLGETVSPELDARQVLLTQFSPLKKELQDKGVLKHKDSPEWKRLVDELNVFSSKDMGYLSYITPDSDEVFSIKVGPMIINRLFGRKGADNVKEIKSLLEEMQAQGMSPFLSPDKQMNETGWVLLYQTGEKLATEHHVEVLTTQSVVEVSGQRVTVNVPEKRRVHPGLATLPMDKIPDPIAFEKKFMWTEEESTLFVESKGLRVPDRFIKNNDEDTKELREATPPPSTSGVDLASVMPPDAGNGFGALPF